MMRELPILFNDEMVRAIVEGRKTQTRRIIKPAPTDNAAKLYNNDIVAHDLECDDTGGSFGFGFWDEDGNMWKCPFGRPGDRLYVREAWQVDAPCDGTWSHTAFYGCRDSPLSDIPERFRTPDHCLFRAGYTENFRINWRPSIHMPRWASRITLEVKAVRVERLQDISEADARAEGIIDEGCLNCGMPETCGCGNPSPDARDAFVYLWKSIHGAESWAANPWVWVIEFERVK